MLGNWKTALIVALAFSFGAAACSPRKMVKRDSDSAPGAAGDAGYDGASSSDGTRIDGGVEAGDVEEARIRGKEFVPTPDLKTVHFEFDMYSLSDDTRTALRENANYLKANPSVEVLVEGYCDDRGTSEYNLALGQKRAKAVRDYYIRLGVPGRSIATISFGEERLACTEQTEACWLENRRAITKIRSQVSSTEGEGYGDTR